MAALLESSTFRVEAAEAGERLDVVLARRAPGGLSRSRYQALVRSGHVALDGAAVREPSQRVAADAEISVGLPEPEPAVPAAQPIPLDVLHEDSELIVIDKPAGLVVHPGAGNPDGTLVNALLAHCGDSLSGIGGVRRPGIVHRLDKDTSGLLVVAKTDRAHQGLAAQFADHGREGPLLREYQALVWGVPDPHIGTIDAPLHRDPSNRLKQAVARSGGRHASTHYALAEAFGETAALVTCRLETGRTHQIRVHLAYLGHPVIGDPVYATGFRTKARTLPAELRGVVEAFRRQALHARRMRFAHPVTGEVLEFERGPPPDMARLIAGFRRFAKP